MNDEIKEYVAPTLEYLKECVEDDIIFETSNCKALLDYITNLQQENEELKKDVELFKSDLISCTNTGLSLITKIDKAIEYIKNCEIVDKDKRYPLLEEQFGDDLLNILQNGSDSQ